MTIYTDLPPASALHAPVLPDDKTRAKELWEAVQGTDLEAQYRQISAQHPDKALSRTHYLAFLEALEELFVAEPEATAPPLPVADFDPARRGGLAPIPEAAPMLGAASEPPAPSANADETPATVQDAGEAPVLRAVSGPGLLAQLAGLLTDGGQLTLQLLRVGDELTVGIFPHPHPGETQAQPLMVTQTPEWLDQHLVSAMQGYVQARRDAVQACQAAAQQQQVRNQKAAEKPKAAASPQKSRQFKVELQAAPDTTLQGDVGGKTVDLVIGENQVPQGNLIITASHPLFGEVKKTLSVYADKAHDFREQQGGRVQVTVTPEDAALTATLGEITLAFHGEVLLPPGRWTVRAEAAEHEPTSQTVAVKAGKVEALTLSLAPITIQSLF